MAISTFKAKCASCGGEFSHPSLGDFAYGEFLFTGEEGTVYCHFKSLDHPVWGLVERILSSQVATADRGATIQAACAALADPIKGQRFVNGHVCPICQSSSWESWEGERVGSTDVPEAAFTQVLLLPLHEQEAAVLACLDAHRPNTSLERAREG